MLRDICVLVADADAATRELVQGALRRQQARVLLAATGDEALQQARQHRPDVVILDVHAGADGFYACRELRRTSDVPVLLLTDRTGEADRVQGLDLGADDYITKPFGQAELVARIRAVLRRARAGQGAPLLDLPDLRVDTATREVCSRGQRVQLSPREFALLVFLMRHPRQALSREQLLAQVWGPGAGRDGRRVDTHVKKLRNKLGDPARRHIRTLRGVGYRFEVDRPE